MCEPSGRRANGEMDVPISNVRRPGKQKPANAQVFVLISALE